MRKAMTFMFATALALIARAATADEKPTLQEVGDRIISRKPYDVNRDGRGNMLLDPLPFTKEIPKGAPDIDRYPTAGYNGDVTLEDPKTTVWGVHALNAGICREGEKCHFTFVYVLGVQKTYAPGKPDDVGIRYIIEQAGTRLWEGFVWGTDVQGNYFLREKSQWRPVPDGPGQEQAKEAVRACNSYHKAQVAAVQGP